MHSVRSLFLTAALIVAPAITHAVPVTYSFDLVITEINIGTRPDPHYLEFAVGQTLHGTFVYDPDTAVPNQLTPTSQTRFYRAVTYSVPVGNSVVNGHPQVDNPTPAIGPRLLLGNSNPGEGIDYFSLFDEVPHMADQWFGNSVGQMEEFWFSFRDADGAAMSSATPGPIDFSQFDSGTWGFWWEPVSYSRLSLSGVISNIQQVPEPGALALLAAGLFGIFGIRVRRRARIARV